MNGPSTPSPVASTQVEMSFPVLGITPDQDLWGFADRGELTTCGKMTLRDNMQDSMQLIDAGGRCFRVVAVRRLGGVGLRYGLACFLAGVSWIEQDLEVLPDLDLEAVLARVCTCMEARAEDWVWPDVTLDERLAEVRAVRSIAGIHEVLGLDHFRGY